ncbi:MAG TPA: ABC transporter ATP-binding protein [Anaerolineales bacterium]|nr:ABC transporter ATP-binding protein [Anaerolineales bacterium]
MTILELRDLSAGYGQVQILWDVNLSLEKGQLTSLVGGNGAGKTTLLRAVMGSIKPWRGSVMLDGRTVTGMPPYGKASAGLVLVPEGRQLFPRMTVYENLEMGAEPRRARNRMADNFERVFTMFPRLKERSRQHAGTLSGGEQQMLAVARGLMAEPEILMIDELSLGLAPVLVLSLFESLLQLKADGLTMLLVEQNVRMALTVSDYAYVLAEGRVAVEGPAKEVAENPEVKKAYLGL